MTAKLFVLAAMLACTGLMPVPAAANLLQNHVSSPGDPTGWSAMGVTLSGNFGGHITQVLLGPDPTIHLSCTANGCGAEIDTDVFWGAIMQSLPTVPGQTYRIHYLVSVLTTNMIIGGGLFGAPGGFVAIFNDIGYMGANPFVDAPGPPFIPLPPGSPLNVSFTAEYVAGTYDESFFAMATGSSTVIEFASDCPGCNFLIAPISVDPIPEPPTSLLVAAGLVAIGMSVGRGCTYSRPSARPDQMDWK